MKHTQIIYIVCLMLCIVGIGSSMAQTKAHKQDETIFVWGGDINLKFTQYIADLTKKEKPKICYLPTASADNSDNIKYWGSICNKLKIDTLVLKVWVSSSEKNQSFEEILLHSDAIVVGGGNTLNMLGIWKAQGIDKILRKALKRGIILAGGSAGSICWFQEGVSDSRPVSLSMVKGLGILPYSNCPHYSEQARKNLYQNMIRTKKTSSGYACDELAGVLFRNRKAIEFVSQSDRQNSYFVYAKKGRIESERMKSKILLAKDALPEGSYNAFTVKKKIADLLNTNDQSSPLNAYVLEIKNLRLNKNKASESATNKILSINIETVFVYNNKLAGVVNDAYLDSFGYGIWYFYNCDGIWTSMGEDIGGETISDSEITFREKAKRIIERAKEKLNCH